MVYKIKVHRDVIRKDSQKFDKKTKDKIKKKCRELLSQNPKIVGEPLRLELSGYRKLKVFNSYRVIYRIDERQKVVFILAVGFRRDLEVYKEAIGRLGHE